MSALSHTPTSPPASAAPIALDPSVFIGEYPFRHVPHPEPEILLRVMERESISHAWVGHLSSAFEENPSAGNVELFKALEPYRAKLSPAPAIRPDFQSGNPRCGMLPTRALQPCVPILHSGVLTPTAVPCAISHSRAVSTSCR